MDIEDIYEYVDFQCFVVCVWILCDFDCDDVVVCWVQYCVWLCWDWVLWVMEELDDEDEQQLEWLCEVEVFDGMD